MGVRERRDCLDSFGGITSGRATGFDDLRPLINLCFVDPTSFLFDHGRFRNSDFQYVELHPHDFDK
jgi:hypothetical protein